MPNYSLLKHFAQNKHTNYYIVTFLYYLRVKNTKTNQLSEHLHIFIINITVIL